MVSETFERFHPGVAQRRSATMTDATLFYGNLSQRECVDASVASAEVRRALSQGEMYTQPVKSRARVPERGRNRARMVDGTLIIVSLAMEAVTQINRKSLRAHKTGHKQCVQIECQGVSGVVHSARLCTTGQQKRERQCTRETRKTQSHHSYRRKPLRQNTDHHAPPASRARTQRHRFACC